MPPKRKAAATKGRAATAKKAKKTEPEDSKSLAEKLRKEDTKKSKKAMKFKRDPYCTQYNDAEVVEDYSCMLNQTNIGANNNKFYVIQLLEDKSLHIVFTRWGRVGEPGATGYLTFLKNLGRDPPISSFEKKFKDKTKNDWKKRDNFTPAKGKYTLLDMDGDDDEEEDETDAPDVKPKTEPVVKADCSLDDPSQEFVQLIFDNDMFKDTMANMDLDVKKMPLGKLSKSQVAKGFEVLDEMEEALKKKASHQKMMELSSRFYTVIPHSFGRSVPPVIGDQDTVNKKKEMLLILGDIVIAQDLKKEQESKKSGKHVLDEKYETLGADLKHLDKNDKEYKMIDTYLKCTADEPGVKIRSLWKVNRSGEEDRHKKCSSYGNRKLLWHGTGVAVAAAILKSGLRIMPHSGGRVGKGIYFASEANKSLGYMYFNRLKTTNVGVIFLNEVALGDVFKMYSDGEVGYKQTKPPNGKVSTWAVGHREPDPKALVDHKFSEGRSVKVPKGKVIKQPNDPKASSSSFYQSEYVVYDEAQVRMRYVILLER